MALDINSSTGHYNVGVCCGLLGDIELVVAFYKKAIFLDENYFKNHFDMARTYIALKQKTKAEKALEKCLELVPNYRPALDLKNNL